jgi:hypothetical protein
MQQNKNVLSNSRTKLFIHRLNKFFHPTAQQNSSCIKIKTFYQTAEQKFLSICQSKTHHASKQKRFIHRPNKNFIHPPNKNFIHPLNKNFIHPPNKTFYPTAEQKFSSNI